MQLWQQLCSAVVRRIVTRNESRKLAAREKKLRLRGQLHELPNFKEPDQLLKAVVEQPENMQVRGMVGRYVRSHYVPGDPNVSPAALDALCRIALPELIRIETASACNLRCQHCTTGVAYRDTDRRVMQMATFNRVIDQVNRIPTIATAVLYLGGEPLLNKNHALMCRRIKQETHIKRTKFVTNGMLIDEEWCDKLADADVDSISVSIDGVSPAEHNLLRTRSEYDAIRKNVWLLKNRLEQRGSKTKLQLGNTQIKCAGGPKKADIPDFLAKEFPGFDISAGYAMVWPGMEAEETRLEGLTVQHKTPRNFCDHPFFDIAVRANGDMILCCYDISGKHVVGNVARDEILEIYQSDAYVELRRAMLEGRKDAVPDVCRRCANFTGSTFSRDGSSALKLKNLNFETIREKIGEYRR